ncbi:MAG TPA: sulfotransferase family 2 domain-containing protein [Candidatus Tumulicola sp.]
MPVSRSLSFAFIHVRKTAGTSMSRALESIDPQLYLNEKGLWDVLCVHPDRRHLLEKIRAFYLVGSVNNFPQWHLPAVIVRDLVGRREWHGLFSFAFVRNPWDLVVSAYHFERRYLAQTHVNRVEPDRAEAIRRCATFEQFVRLYPLLEPLDMTSMIVDENDRNIVSFVGRFESLSTDFAEICRQIGASGVGLPHENRSEDRRDYRSYYSAQTRQIVARYFSRDIDRFEYEY